MKIGIATDAERVEAKDAADVYMTTKKTTPSEAVRGFIIKNVITGLTIKEIDTLVQHAERLSNGELKGDGDKFKLWCEKKGREIPSDDLVRFMNGDPHGAKEEIRRLIPTHPKLWRAYGSYLAGVGR